MIYKKEAQNINRVFSKLCLTIHYQGHRHKDLEYYTYKQTTKQMLSVSQPVALCGQLSNKLSVKVL